MINKQNYYTMNNKVLRKLVTDDLKSIGVKRNDYSLKINYHMYDRVIKLLIKNPYINIVKVEEKLKKYNMCDYDKVSLEALKGCNVYVFINYMYGVFDEVLKPYLELATKAFNDHGEREDRQSCTKVTDKITLVNDDVYFHTDSHIYHRVINDEYDLATMLFKAENHGNIE